MHKSAKSCEQEQGYSATRTVATAPMLSFEWLGHITTGMVKYQRNTRIQKDKLSVAALAPHGIASGFDDRRQLCHEKKHGNDERTNRNITKVH